eukprot:11441394-Ditylum_brightwellii.AAC.1
MGISAILWGQFKAPGYYNPWKTRDLITPIYVSLGVTVVPIATATGWHAQDLAAVAAVIVDSDTVFAQYSVGGIAV